MSLLGNEFINSFLNEIDSGKLLTEYIQKDLENPSFIQSDKCINLLAIGKAAVAMASAIEQISQSCIKEELIVTKLIGEGRDFQNTTNKRIIFAGHPIPDERSYEAGEQVIEFVRNSQKANELLIVCISGGASALVESIVEGFEKSKLEKTTDILLRSDASITEINTLRSFFSRIKGGGLAQLIKYPTNTMVYVLSDVIGNQIGTIASGPFKYTPISTETILALIEKYQLPINRANVANLISYKVKYFDVTIKHHIIADNSVAKAKLFEIVESKFQGYKGIVVDEPFQCNVTELVDKILHLCDEMHKSEKPWFLILGGESTVAQTGNGRGGRNTELIARLLLAYSTLQTIKTPTIYAIATDGNDGNSNSGGAYLDEKLINRVKTDTQFIQGLEKSISESDTATFLLHEGFLLPEKQTNTNLLDCVLIIQH